MSKDELKKIKIVDFIWYVSNVWVSVYFPSL